ncbi:unnamed protein product [Allacma fusca]|uniref:Protein tipE n=1 Tax=Allacma fusca TaxID=39272 RepID=A0A8J2J8K1_9HEXA|nr:unnamed protein product [Allacma fusca]
MGGKKVCAWLLANCEVQLCSALAAMSLLGVVVVCPVMLDPAIETLASSFEDAQCRTVYSRVLQGMSNCTWTSCREGCTADIYSCWHIIVVYMTKAHLEIYQQNDGGLKLDNKSETTRQSSSILSFSSAYRFDQDLDYDLTRNLTSGLSQMLQEINLNIQNDTVSKFLGIGALYPNQQKCVYPSDTICTTYFNMYGKKGGPSFPCFVSLDNLTMVVTTVDKVRALRNIFYCFIPLIIASAVFTYLFYRVGLIGDSRNRLKNDEESDSKNQNRPGKNGLLPNGAPAGAPKKLRKKFLPKRKDSSKKRRARKNLKKTMSIKNQLSIKSASSSRRTPSVSMAGISDDLNVFSKPRTSVPYL